MYNRHNLSIMSSRTKNKTVEELMATLLEDMRFSRITRADGDTTLLAILKQQQVTIEQNQKKIKEQQELIEHLWAWAEERDEAKYDGKTPSEADAEAYLNLMYPVEEEEPPKDKDGDLAPVIRGLCPRRWSLLTSGPSTIETSNCMTNMKEKRRVIRFYQRDHVALVTIKKIIK